MASVAAQRTGLITATVVASIVALTALVFAFIFSAQASRERQTSKELTTKYNDVIKQAALNGPIAQQLKADRSAENSGFSTNDTLIDVAVTQRDQFVKLVGGTTPQVAMTSTKGGLAALNEALVAAKQPKIDTEGNASEALRTAANAINALHQQNDASMAAAAAAKSESEKMIAAAKAQMDANAKNMADVRGQGQAATDIAAKEHTDIQGVLNSATNSFETSNKAAADALAKVVQGNADLTREVQRMQKEVNTVRAKLDMYRPDAIQSTVRKADGNITRISTDNTVYINLGAGQQIVPGMTFEVYNKLEGVPALKTDESSLPTGKAAIEVVRVGSNSSECRVLHSKPGQTITEGDVVANLVYDVNTKYNFVVYGKFDLTKKGSPSAEDAAVVKRLVSEFGGKVEDKVAVDTDFLVIGSEPVIPDFSEEQRRDPVNAKILADAQAEVDAYNAVLNKAKELFIPVLNQNRFLYYVGYFEKARR